MRLLICIAALALAGVCDAAEVQVLDEKALRRARTLIEEGDVATALPLIFKILRDAPDKEDRQDARETLEKMGMSKADILQLDPAAMKPEELEKWVKLAGERSVTSRRMDLDVEYAKDLMRLAVSPRLAGGEVTVDVHHKELCRALEILLQTALAENGGEHAREAQKELEEIGVVGARVSAVKQACAGGEIPAEIQNEIIFSTCVNRLERYKDWYENADADAEDAARRQVAGDLGPALYKYLLKSHAQSPQLQGSSETLAFWRDSSKLRRTD